MLRVECVSCVCGVNRGFCFIQLCVVSPRLLPENSLPVLPGDGNSCSDEAVCLAPSFGCLGKWPFQSKPTDPGPVSPFWD